MKLQPRLWTLLIGANALIVAMPLFAAAALRLYDTYLMRQTERQLIAQSVLIGEAWREAWLRERGQISPPASDRGLRPPGKENFVFAPVEPLIDLGTPIAPPQARVASRASVIDDAKDRAGRSVQGLVERAQVFNLSAVRILDERGCVLATTRSERGLCLSELEEVAAAMTGRYASVPRERVTDEPLPSPGDMRRRGRVRIFTALPVFHDGELVAIVRLSRTSLDALTTLWLNRREFLLTAALSIVLLISISALSALAIARPLRRLARYASAVASGSHRAPLESGWAPREVSELSDAIAHMTRELSDRAAYAAEFAANVTHELRTPLTSIRGAAELLDEQGSRMPESQRARFVRNIHADATHMAALVGRLLTLARLENRPATPPEPIDIREFFSSLIDRYGTEVELTLANTAESLRIEPEHLTTLVTNLIDNALRHRSSGPVTLRVAEVGGHFVVEVADNGFGISPSNATKIFERFFTTERARGGTGLGLAMATAIVHGRGGSLRVERRNNHTVFIADLGPVGR